MIPRRLIILIVLLLIAFWAGAQDGDRNACIMKVSSAWGSVCERCEVYDGFKRDFRGTFRIELRNSCRELVEVKVAVQEKNGSWRIFPTRTLGPEETLTAYACTGTGRYLYWAKRVNDPELAMPTDREILSEYRSR